MPCSSFSSNLDFFLIATACVLSACIDLPSLNPPPDPRLDPLDRPEDDPGYFNGSCPTCCPDWGCGSNSAWLGENLVFHELDATGMHANNTGLFVYDFRDYSGNLLELGIDHDELVGKCTVKDRDCAHVGQLLTRVGLHQAKLRLLDGSAASKTLHTLTIRSTSTTPFWNGPSESAPIYEFTYDASADKQPNQLPLCRPTSDPMDPLKGMALIFRGDRYVARDKTVTITAADDPWFNIACAQTAIAKLHLLRHTSAADRDGMHPTSQPERQALLKMLTADYCGTGKGFTVTGHALMYSYQQSWVPKSPCDVADPKYWQHAGSIDAVFSSGGAVCLDVPRLHDIYGDSFRELIVDQCPVGPATPPLGYCPSDLLAQLRSPPAGAPPPWPGYAIAANPSSTCPPP